MLRSALILFAFLLASSAAHAATCSFSITTGDFGNVDALSGAPATTTATLSVSCTGVLTNVVTVCANIGAGSGGSSSGVRRMASGANTLDYQLYQDAAYTIPWGSTLTPTLGLPARFVFTTPLFVTSFSTTRTIYARVLGGQQTTPPGAYVSNFTTSDTQFTYDGLLSLTCTGLLSFTASPTFTMEADIVPNCRVTTQSVDFGQRAILDAALDATGAIDVTCTPGSSYSVALDGGLSGGQPTARKMRRGSETITYGLYKDAARSQQWGGSGADLVTGTGAGTVQSLPVYARTPQQTTPSPGLYADTVVVTVGY